MGFGGVTPKMQTRNLINRIDKTNTRLASYRIHHMVTFIRVQVTAASVIRELPRDPTDDAS